VPVRQSAYKQTPLKNYQAVLDPGKPLASMTKAKRDQAWVKVCEEIQKAANLLPEQAPSVAGNRRQWKMMRSFAACAILLSVGGVSMHIRLTRSVPQAKRAGCGIGEPPSELNDDVTQVITLAAVAARDFQALPLDKLEFATSYGLDIHPTIFWGQATSTALGRRYSCENRAEFEEVADIIKKRGLPPVGMPSVYKFEMLARVLEAALALASFNIGALPRGYLKTAGRPPFGILSRYHSLFIASIGNDPGLHLMSVDPSMERIGSFVARELDLHALCAQRNEEGSLDLVAQDDQHLYCWRRSGEVPAQQFPIPGRKTILAARFLSTTPGAAVATIDRDGIVTVIAADSKRQTVQRPFEGQTLDDARIWIDALDKDTWYAVGRTREHKVISSP
jgi:hypothetical protein